MSLQWFNVLSMNVTDIVHYFFISITPTGSHIKKPHVILMDISLSARVFSYLHKCQICGHCSRNKTRAFGIWWWCWWKHWKPPKTQGNQWWKFLPEEIKIWVLSMAYLTLTVEVSLELLKINLYEEQSKVAPGSMYVYHCRNIPYGNRYLSWPSLNYHNY